MTSSHPLPAQCQWFSWLASALDRRSAPRLAPLILGAVLARVFGLLVNHKAWRTIALPLLARLYVWKKDLPALDLRHRPAFRTPPELAVELLRWARPSLVLLGKPIRAVADGAYAQ